jgi:hypothetical protein
MAAVLIAADAWLTSAGRPPKGDPPYPSGRDTMNERLSNHSCMPSSFFFKAVNG